MYKKILSPLDGSKLAECALEQVRAVATGCKVLDVVLLAVLSGTPVVLPADPQSGAPDPRMIEWAQQAEERTEAEMKDYLASTADRLKKEGVAAVQAVTVKGRPADEILDFALKNSVDLIVMATHGRSGPSRWLMGSVADRVVRISPIPVLLVSPPGCRLPELPQ